MSQSPRSRECSPLPLLHHLHEILEQIMRIVWAGARFRVVLHAKQRQIPVPQAFERVVIQINVGEFNFTLRKRIGIHGKVMVVRGDFNLSGVQLLHWMISAVVAEFQLESLSAERNSCELMSKTNSEDRLATHQAANVVHGVRARFGIAGPIREKHTVRLERENIFGGSLRGNDRYLAALAAQ